MSKQRHGFFIYIRIMKRVYSVLFFLFATLGIQAQEQFTVYFQSNKALLQPIEKARLEKWVLNNKSSKILAINGFTDEDGTNQFNDTLAKKRVDNIFQLVKDKVKIREDFKKLSFGENHQQSKNKAENRRVTVFYLLEKDLSKEKEIVGLQNKGIQIQKQVVFPESIIVTNIDGSEVEYHLDVAFMKKIHEAQPGEKIKMENLNFVLNTFAVVKESRAKLYELLLVMQQNPNLKISIQGHVCCVANDRQDLSTQRAKAIKIFLEQNKIPSNRMTFKGFGSSLPIYPLPEKTEAERAANRRVEIEILSNN